MTRLKLMLATAMVVGLSLAFAGSAFAAAALCGQCHGAYINDNHGGKTLMPGVLATEDVKTPQAGDICNNNGRGLHGVHMNYSSATYGQWSRYSNTHASTRGSCDYCHNKHSHENGFVEFSGVSVTTATQSAISAGLKVSGTGIGANGLDITQMDGNATCTTACHKGTSATNPAAWGNYTTPTIHLTCNSCHGDASNYGPTASNTGLGNGSTGTGGHKVHLYSVGGSHGNQLLGGTKIVLGSFSTVIDMNGNSDKVCAACHPDNTNDLWSQGRADDGSKKAYPHATDGTNVKAINASFVAPANIVFTNASGLADTVGNLACTNACHFNKSSVQSANPTWKASSGCELCHNHTPTEAANNSAIAMGGRPLTFAHSLHFNAISSMHIGSGTVSRTDSTPTGLPSCNDCHTDAHTVNAVGGPQLYQLPVKDGAAGVLSTTGYSAAGTISVSGTCTNRCHISASPAWNTIATGVVIGTTGCATCHSYPGVAGRDWTGTNGHMARASTFQDATTAVIRKSIKHLNVATAYNALNDTYAGVTGDVRKCGKCHAGATHMNGTVNVADSNSLGQCSTTSFTYNNISSNPTNRIVNCSNVSCHFGKTTPNWF